MQVINNCGSNGVKTSCVTYHWKNDRIKRHYKNKIIRTSTLQHVTTKERKNNERITKKGMDLKLKYN